MEEQCKSCKAPVIWAKTAAGKSIPLDRKPVEDGNIRLSEEGTATILSKDGVALAKSQWQPLYKSHFATCPNAARHRKK